MEVGCTQCGSRTEQYKKYMLNSLAAVIHKNKRNAGGNSEEIVHPPELLEG